MIDDTIKKDVKLQNEEPAVDLKAKEPDVVDVDLGFVEKKRFRIAGDYNRMLELNVSDLNVFVRLKEGYPKLQVLLTEAQQKVAEIPDNMEDADEFIGKIADALEYIDKEMRGLIDFIFDADVSRVVAPSGNMYDPVNGQYRFERVLDIVTGLYSTGLNTEFNKMKTTVEKKAAKYRKKK